MTFANPMLLGIGLAAIALPILIHFLMRRRRKPIAWAAMRFLLEAYRQQRRRMRLEQLILLAVRCLLVGLIALAVGRPMLRSMGVLGSGASTTLVILLDNSLTSQVSDAAGRTALERHKKQADALLASLRPGSGDRAALVTLGGPAEAIVWPASADVPAVRRAVESVLATDSAADMTGAIKPLGAGAGAGGARDAASNVVVALLSDFYDGSVNLRDRLGTLVSGAPGQGGPEVSVLASQPASVPASNTSLARVEAQRGLIVGPQPVLAQAELRRAGALEGATQTVHFRLLGLNAEVLSQAKASVRWKAGQSSATVSATLDPAPAGNTAAVLTASLDPSGIRGDDVARQVLERRTSLRVGVIAPRRDSPARSLADFAPEEWVLTALAPERMGEGEISRVEATTLEPALADASRLAGLDAVVVVRPDLVDDGLWGRLRSVADRGGLVMVVAPAIEGAHTWPDAMLRALPTGWVIDRESGASEAGQGVVRGGGASAAAGDSSRDVLAPLGPELTGLLEPLRVFRWLRVTAAAGTERLTPSLSLADGSAWLVASSVGAERARGRGLVVLMASAIDFDWTNLAAKPLFPAMLQDAIRQGVGLARGQLVSVAGQTPVLATPSVQIAPVGVGDASGGVLAVDEAGRASSAIRRAGLWRASDRNGATSGLLVVTPDLAAASLQPQSATDVQSWLASLAGGRGSSAVRWLDEAGAISQEAPAGLSSSEAGSGLRWGLWFMLAALGLALVEVALARWFSHATIAPAGGQGGARASGGGA